MLIKPANDAGGNPLRVRFESIPRLLADAGEDVVESPYWWRRIAQGDVILMSGTTLEAPPPTRAAHKGGSHA